MSVQVIAGDRGWGKTSYIIEWLKERDTRIMLVHSAAYRDSLRAEHVKLEHQIYSVSDYTGNSLHGRIRPYTEVAIDNLELALPQLLDCNVTTVSVTPTITGSLR